MTDTGLTDLLTEFAIGLRGARLPSRVRAAANETTGNVLALAVGAAAHPAVESALAAVRPLGAAPDVAMLGRTDRLPAIWAALVHGIAAHVEDYDDTHPPTVIHPGAAVVPAALSAAVLADADGAELLAAVSAGVEATLRVGNALMPTALDRGWHMTGIAGGIGAALAAGTLLGLDARALRNALGIAATQSAGVLEALGSMAKPLHPGKAASNGVEAVLLARHGLDGPAAPIEGRRGLLALHTGAVHVEAAARDLGETWELTRNEIKPYACGVVSHSIIDLAAALAEESSVIPEAVILRVHPFVLVAMGRTAPRTGLQAKFSATHCFAVGFRHRIAGPAQFSEQVVHDEEIRELRARCELVPTEGTDRYAVLAEIRYADGSMISRHRQAPEPLGTERLRRKALALTEPVLGAAAADFVPAAFALQDVASVRQLMDSATPQPYSADAHRATSRR